MLLHLLFPVLLQGAPTDIAERFPPPPGFERQPIHGFGAWLRAVPLAAAGTPVKLHNGALLDRQDMHAAVLDFSVGTRDLQQCADAVIRLRAEYLYETGQEKDIAFHFTNGFLAEWSRWKRGERIVLERGVPSWVARGGLDGSHAQLMAFLETVFIYAGTISLAKELVDASDRPVLPGDVYVRAGSPGHAMLVMDVAIAPGGERVFLLAQSYMPARSIHVVKNPEHPELGAWYQFEEGASLRTPQWTFSANERKSWP